MRSVASFVIGTFPRDPINEVLDAAARSEQVNGHSVRTVRIQSLNDIGKCHVVFVSASVGRQAAVLERAECRPILNISDAPGFPDLGGHVPFMPQPPGTALRISVANMRASGLECRAQRLRFAAAP
jgi:hypothetical protein